MFSKLCRIGNEPELRFTTSGKAVLSLSLAYNYGQKGKDGKKPTQWIEGTLWDKQAEGVAPHLKKGDQLSVCIDDLHVEEYEGKNGKGHKLAGRIVSLDFVSGKREGGEQGQQTDSSSPSASKPAPEQSKPAPAKGSGFDNFDDEPF